MIGTGFDILFAASIAPMWPADPAGAVGVTATAITWTWTDNSNAEGGFRLWQGAAPAAPTGPPTSTVAANTTHISAAGLTPNTQ
jgi:hypothetical protein